MNRFKFSNYKLPYMAPFNNDKAESPKIKNPKTTQEEEMAKAKEAFRRISQKPLLEPKPLHSNSIAKQTVSSSGGNNDEELKKFLEGIHEVDNPEYTDPNNPEYEAPRSTEHDFFIKNRSKESDSIAKVFMNLDKDARRLRGERNFKAAGEKQNEINNLLKYIKNENANRIKK